MKNLSRNVFSFDEKKNLLKNYSFNKIFFPQKKNIEKIFIPENTIFLYKEKKNLRFFPQKNSRRKNKTKQINLKLKKNSNLPYWWQIINPHPPDRLEVIPLLHSAYPVPEILHPALGHWWVFHHVPWTP